jgi:hypothetical protein
MSDRTEKKILASLKSGPLYRGALELIVGEGDLAVPLRRLLAEKRVEIAREIGPATYRLRD